VAKVNGGRTDAEREERRIKVARLYLNKITQHEIAKKLGISQGTVSNDLKAIKVEWKKEYAEILDERKAQELAELQSMERDAATGFAKSKDSRFLAVRLQIKGRISKLLGLDAPERKEIDIIDDRVILLDAIIDQGEEEPFDTLSEN
jgi:predicted transcriptional regulator